MDKHGNRFAARELFMNPKLTGILPQFDVNEKLQNVYSFARTEERVAQYLANAFNGSLSGNGDITVFGRHKDILNRVRQLRPLIETVIDNTPKIVRALRGNTHFYLPYANVNELKRLNAPGAKIKVLRSVSNNLQYSGEHKATDETGRGKNFKYRRLKKI